MDRSYKPALVGLFSDPGEKNPGETMMEAGFESQNLAFRYITVPVEKGHLKEVIEGMRAFHMKGVNLTIPHKTDVIPFLQELSPAAALIGAVNSVRNQDGKLIGENTDGKGFVTSLIEKEVMICGKTVAILGAGETARAIAVESALSGARKIYIINRKEEQGRELSSLIQDKTKAHARYISWEKNVKIPKDTDILVNATGIGFFPDEGKPDVDYEGIQENMTVCDMVFYPPETGFLAEAKKRGAKTADGLGMLVNQEALNYSMWTERPAPKEVMEEALREEFHLTAEGKLKKNDSSVKDRILIDKMIEYYAGDPKRIQHFLKVYEFAALIGEKERLEEEELHILKTAAIVHDIGIKISEEKYHSSSGKYQEKEGPAAAEPMLKDCGYEEEVIDRVLYLIAHHHTYHDIEGEDYQILVEADFLVNLYEDHCKKEAAVQARDRIFRTKTGRWYLEKLFL